MTNQKQKKTIIAFGAHHDDIEIRAGGTVAKYVKMGYEVIYVTLIDSVYINKAYQHEGKDYKELTNDDILEIRSNESRKGAKILGTAETIFFHLKPSYHWTPEKSTGWRMHFNNSSNDDKLFAEMKKYKGKYFCLQAAYTSDCVAEIAGLIKKYNPEFVITQQPNDLHLEHYAVSSLIFTACRQLVSEGLNFKLYAWEMGSSGRMIKFVPDVIIDITNEFSTKLEAIKPFVSQRGKDSEVHIRYAEASAQYWGKKIGVKYAEPFSEMMIAGNAEGFYQNGDDFNFSSFFPGIEYVKSQF